MAKVNLCGVRNLDFLNDSGENIKGIKLYFSYVDPNVVGEVTDNKFLSSSLCSKLGVSFEDLKEYIGHPIDIDVNLNGKICGISALED